MNEISHEGDWFKQQLKKAGINHSEVAYEIGYDVSTVWRWLNKEKLSTRQKKLLADVLKIDLREYFNDVESVYESSEQTNYRIKYRDLLEKYARLEEEFAQYKLKHSDGTKSGQ